MTSLQMEDPASGLKEAATNGDVEYLRKCVESNKPMDYYLTDFEEGKTSYDIGGNIFHYAAYLNREEFIREAIENILPIQLIQQLILQPRSTDSAIPLHLAAANGNVEIVKMFLNIFTTTSESSSPSSSIPKPWLHKDGDGETPCFWAIRNDYEECGLEILRMDLELLSNMTTVDGRSILFHALEKELSTIALEILRFSPSFSSSSHENFFAFDALADCEEQEGQEICRLLLEKDPKQFERVIKDKALTLEYWAKNAKLWAFKCLLKCNDIIPDIRKTIVSLISEIDDDTGENVLHILASGNSANEEDIVEIAKLLIDSYKLEKGIDLEEEFPWLVEDKDGDTPLSNSIDGCLEKLAMYFISQDHSALIKSTNNLLFLAIENQCNQVAEMILDIVENQRWIQLLTNHQRVNALHLAPKCNENICKRLLKHHPELLRGVDEQGFTVVHKWAEIGEIWPFEYVVNSGVIEAKWRSYFIRRTRVSNYNFDNPIHVVASSTLEEKDNIAKFLITAYKEAFPDLVDELDDELPWFCTNKLDQAPLHIAIRNQRQNLAIHILSQRGDDDDDEEECINKILDFYEPVHDILFLAMKNECYQVVKEILTRLQLQKEDWTKYVKDFSNCNILHLAPTCTDKTFGTWLVNEASEFISIPNNAGNTPLVEASSFGAEWIIKAMLIKDSLTFTNEPLAWVKACENGHVLAVRAFIDYNPGRFRDHCVKLKDSPLHHIRLSSLTDYEEFLNLPRMKDLINLQDVQGATPLHIAIWNEDIFFTETLLSIEKTTYTIKDVKNETAIDLLEQICFVNRDWDEMCKRIGFDPSIKTTYFQRHTNLLDVRNTISVVAALLATITFTAGFTLPGGFDQNTGAALLAKRATFLVFLISDSLALFFSILVLVSLIWSMVYEPSKSLLLIDRSMVLLMRALYCTLVAFMTGVYVVISPKALWAAILILVIMCILLGISVSKTLLYNGIKKFIPAANKDQIDSIKQLELGKVFSCFQDRSSLPEAIPLTSNNPITQAE